MSCLNETKLTVYPSSSSWRSSTIPWSSTCAALCIETFGIAPPSDRLVCREDRRGALVAHGVSASSSGGRELLVGEQAVLHREQPRGGTRRCADLRVDVLHVVAGGLRRDHEVRRDLAVR